MLDTIMMFVWRHCAKVKPNSALDS